MNCSGEDTHAIDNKIRREHSLSWPSVSGADGQVAVSAVVTLFN